MDNVVYKYKVNDLNIKEGLNLTSVFAKPNDWGSSMTSHYIYKK